MNIRNCPKCKKAFAFVSSPICPTCEKEENESFERLVEYLKENEGKTIEEVSEATGVSTKKIFKYLKEGRIEATGNFKGSLKCEKCGVDINVGKYCESCALAVEDTINGMFNKPSILNAKRGGPKMHSRRLK